MKKLTGATTPLERSVQKIINRKAGGDYPIECVLDDLMCSGCVSGIIGELCYYKDTLAYYKKHKKEIVTLLNDMVTDCGCSPSELFGDNWDSSDIFAEETNNQNLFIKISVIFSFFCWCSFENLFSECVKVL